MFSKTFSIIHVCTHTTQEPSLTLSSCQVAKARSIDKSTVIVTDGQSQKFTFSRLVCHLSAIYKSMVSSSAMQLHIGNFCTVNTSAKNRGVVKLGVQALGWSQKCRKNEYSAFLESDSRLQVLVDSPNRNPAKLRTLPVCLFVCLSPGLHER